MAMTVDELHREAMALPPEDREELAMRLLQEAQSDPEIEKAWVAECRRRLEDSLRNPRPPRDGFKVIDEVFERVRSKAWAAIGSGGGTGRVGGVLRCSQPDRRRVL